MEDRHAVHLLLANGPPTPRCDTDSPRALQHKSWYERQLRACVAFCGTGVVVVDEDPEEILSASSKSNSGVESSDLGLELSPSIASGTDPDFRSDMSMEEVSMDAAAADATPGGVQVAVDADLDPIQDAWLSADVGMETDIVERALLRDAAEYMECQITDSHVPDLSQRAYALPAAAATGTSALDGGSNGYDFMALQARQPPAPPPTKYGRCPRCQD